MVLQYWYNQHLYTVHIYIYINSFCHITFTQYFHHLIFACFPALHFNPDQHEFSPTKSYKFLLILFVRIYRSINSPVVSVSMYNDNLLDLLLNTGIYNWYILSWGITLKNRNKNKKNVKNCIKPTFSTSNILDPLNRFQIHGTRPRDVERSACFLAPCEVEMILVLHKQSF